MVGFILISLLFKFIILQVGANKTACTDILVTQFYPDTLEPELGTQYSLICRAKLEQGISHIGWFTGQTLLVGLEHTTSVITQNQHIVTFTKVSPGKIIIKRCFSLIILFIFNVLVGNTYSFLHFEESNMLRHLDIFEALGVSWLS